MGRHRSLSRSVSPPRRRRDDEHRRSHKKERRSRHGERDSSSSETDKGHVDRRRDDMSRRRHDEGDRRDGDREGRRDHECRKSRDEHESQRRRDEEKRRTEDKVKQEEPISSSGSSDNSDEDFDKKLEEFRKQKRAEEKAKKKEKKARETEEEKRARRIEKKRIKEEKKASKELPALPESVAYTDLNNPFNDSNLSQPFIWGKKLEAEGKTKLSKKEIEKMSRERIHRSVAEMEELKRNREARQAAREDMEMMAREEERRKNADFSEVERKFHLSQAPLRSQIRIKGNRGQPIDYLALYINTDDPNKPRPFVDLDDVELRDPTEYLKNLNGDRLEDLLADTRIYRLLNSNKNHAEFWDDVEMIARSELKKARESTRDEAVHSSVQADVIKTFKGKSFADLHTLEQDINRKIKKAGRGTDVSFWETILDSLRPMMARQRLKERHKVFLQNKLEKIRAEQRKEAQKLEKQAEQTGPKEEPDNESHEMEVDDPGPSKEQQELKDEDIEAMETMEMFDSNRPLPFRIEDLEGLDDEQRELKWEQLNQRQLLRFTLKMYESGRYSPTYSKESRAMPGIAILDQDEDVGQLRERRAEQKRLREGKPAAPARADAARDQKLMSIARQGMTGEESTFAVEETIQQDLMWSEKYRPQKPKYFNRVHTGFDWNKYNQTHYDVDNPPPKIVQGYRFNIFYPDLLDTTRTPSFTLTECEDPDFAIIRFKSGPPYEDIAFKVVNREWEVNHKHGYKCQFQNGVFQLWFYFKRYRYRR